jgi:hypothetical protein
VSQFEFFGFFPGLIMMTLGGAEALAAASAAALL